MRDYTGNFIFEHPVISVIIAAVLIVLVYVFSRQLNPNELKSFSIYMSIGIVLLAVLFVLAILIPQVVKFYPFVILGIAIAIGIFLYQRSNIRR